MAGTLILIQRSSVVRAKQHWETDLCAEKTRFGKKGLITYLSGVSSLISSGIRSILGFNFCFGQLFSQLFLRSGSFLS